jgi:hypothetical protein
VRERVAQCSCGRLRAVCNGSPDKVSICHCNECRRRTGSAFGIAAFYPRACVRIEGADKRFRRNSDSGFPVTFHFCPDCGASIWWEPSRKPETVGVAVGAFADPDFPMPDQSVADELRHDWIGFPDSMTKRQSG